MTSSSQITLTEDYEILLNDQLIGYFETMGKKDHIIAHIEIDDSHRGNRYSETATKLVLKRAKERNVDRVITTVVTSPAYESILRELGFEKIESGKYGLYLAE